MTAMFGTYACTSTICKRNEVRLNQWNVCKRKCNLSMFMVVSMKLRV